MSSAMRGARFVVHEHHAIRAGLHYDLRLEWRGTLRSWAFRHKPPLKRGVKRLGIPQPNHELSFLDFEGEIERGYGKGVLKIWDRGTYKLLEDRGDRLVVYFEGSKLRGVYVILKWREGWLLFRC